MEFVKQLVPLLLTISLGGLVMTVALNSGRGDLIYVLRRPGLLARAVLAVMVIPPIAAGLLVWMLPLTPAVKAGIMLMAVAPVPPLVPGQEIGVGARKEYAYGVYVAMALLTVVSVPVVFNIAAYLFGRSDTASVESIAGTVTSGVLVPLVVGLLIRQFSPKFAAQAAPVLYKLSMLLVVLAFLPIIVSVWPPMTNLIGNGTLLAMVILVIVSLVGGHILGGPELMDRATLAIAASVRHPGIAMSLAAAHFTDRRVQAAILLFLMVGLVIGTLYKTWIKRTAKKAGRAAA
ncbi:Na+-dependent transporter [Brevundimonas lenta]|uniref:BASS family bile acid:Na+ symporter n=1 Tax=Brevundimonas lenta TaxID=424796 RepID=A0A7W6NPF3_9CAUL|nr:Na+-dependent transporter [Brevundimonas lenta]MBB4082833.1 BASS family bile acid:Na+ symporter [Brevundimonas lenta]